MKIGRWSNKQYGSRLAGNLHIKFELKQNSGGGILKCNKQIGSRLLVWLKCKPKILLLLNYSIFTEKIIGFRIQLFDESRKIDIYFEPFHFKIDRLINNKNINCQVKMQWNVLSMKLLASILLLNGENVAVTVVWNWECTSVKPTVGLQNFGCCL